MKFMFGLQHPLTCKPSTTLSNTCNKVRGKYIWKEVFLRLYPASFLPVSSSCVFLRASLLLSCYDTANEYTTIAVIMKKCQLLCHPVFISCLPKLVIFWSFQTKHSYSIQCSKLIPLGKVWIPLPNHHHHVTPPAWISLNLSHHLSLTSITPSISSRLPTI